MRWNFLFVFQNSYMDDKQILVTGGAGFIGSNLANTLAGDNDVTALDNQYLGTPANLSEEIKYIEADVLDEELPTDVDVVFHLAALSSRQMLEENPLEGARVNIEGFVNIVEQAYEDIVRRSFMHQHRRPTGVAQSQVLKT